MRGFAGTLLAVALAGGLAMAADGSTARAAAPSVAPTPTAPCPTPSVSARFVANPTKTIFCLEAHPGNAHVTLTWQPDIPERLGSAFFLHYQATDAEIATDAGAVVGKSADVPHLANGTVYVFWMTRSESGPTVSNVVQAVPATTPDAPTALTATAANAQVTLTWAAPASTGGAPITGYRITTAPQAGPQTSTDIPATTRYTVPGLTNGTTYNFTVTAVNAIGPGPPSSPVQAVPATTPDAPTGLTTTSGNGQVTLSWAAPASAGGAPITGYDLYVGTTADLSSSTPIARVTGSVVTVVGLANGTRYYFQLIAINRIGKGPASDEASAVPFTVPGAPTGLTATAANGHVTLSWAAPASTGGAPITGYLLYEGISPGGEGGTPIGGQPITATSYSVPDLTTGTRYYFTVVAVNAAGLSPSSGEASAALPASPPASTPSTATPASPPASTPSTATPASPPASTPSTAQPGGASPSAPPSAWQDAPPTRLTATAGDSQATLSWIPPPPEPGGSPVTGYKIYQATAPGALETMIGTANGTDVVVPHLNNGTTYYFTVAALSATGQESTHSTEASAKPQHLGHPVPVPASIPTQLIALLAAAGAAIVAVGFTLITRGGPFRSRARRGQRAAAASDVRAVADTARPDSVRIRNTGREPVHTIRFEPDTGVATTTIKEGRP